MSQTAERLHTIDELPDIPDCYELVKGELIMMVGVASPAHSYIVTQLSTALYNHVVERHLGMVFGAHTGFILTRSPDTVRAPDVAFVRVEQLPPSGFDDGYFQGAPDLAVEVLSESNRASAMQHKITQYFTAGTRLVWVIDPQKRTVAVYSPGHSPTTLEESDTLAGEDVMPEFRYPIAKMFARLRRI